MTATRPLAVVTGASTGIGLELAKLFAAAEYDLVINAENPELHDVRQGIADAGVEVEAVQADLRTDEGVDRLYERIRAQGRPPSAVALNAGIGQGGAFVDNALEDELAIIDLNVRSVVHLAKHVVRDMVAAGEGRVLFTSSIGAALPGSYHAVYNASKAFVQSFAVSLRDELRDSGVTVTTLLPGPTDTEFFERADMEDTRVGQGKQDDPADVARMGFEALMAGDERVVAASLTTKAQARGARFLPDSGKAAMHRRLAEPGGGS